MLSSMPNSFPVQDAHPGMCPFYGISNVCIISYETHCVNFALVFVDTYIQL